MLAWAQTPPTGQAPPVVAAKTNAAQPEGQPTWKTLSPAQREALAPLAPIWSEINSNRKRKWIALSANFNNLSPQDRATLHGRMKEWASLSNAERNRARLNFAQTRELSHEEKKTQWEAYQALSPERKQELAAQAKAPPSGAAPAVTKSPSGKLAAVPVTRSDTQAAARTAPTHRPAASAAAPSSP